MTSAAREKGRRGEHEAAALLHGKRAPLSGAIRGMGDLIADSRHPMGDFWFGDWIWEVKRRAALPNIVTNALMQAEAGRNTVGDRRRPGVLMRGDNGRWLISFWAEDLISWCEALAEVAQGSALKAYVRQIRRVLDELEKRL